MSGVGVASAAAAQALDPTGCGCDGGAPPPFPRPAPPQPHALRWFYFRAANLPTDRPTEFRILNAGQCSFPDGFEGYNVATSYDQADWVRTPASFAGGVLSWHLTPTHPSAYFVRGPWLGSGHAPLAGSSGGKGYCSRARRVERVHGARHARRIGRSLLVHRGPGFSFAWVNSPPFVSHAPPLLPHPAQAYFAPYSYDRHMQLVSSLQRLPHVTLRALGHTIDGRDIDELTVGAG